ncbi:beta-ketoacyl synthase N-terminal-like domain-containing protein [Acanthopleuribacter pedis]|uniref:Ketosynthase family 3 (KS3) domain-containing protein n=1 Tax=Acanthopleuribacter pedis TaxID=442870 RepID=A0A8J7U4D1_9BACT|nr:beta-ketoacyl synthase N-terminal-like domain-containing protein [Acanthopleuribacter pedis]MBO1319303.1 hypothetical protein [Acanthopleuribacter pedis]
MNSALPSDLIISGMGVVSPIGIGIDAFRTGLLRGDHRFAIMQRPGRQTEDSAFLGAECGEIHLPRVPARVLRACSLPGKAALAALDEAWQNARLDGVDPSRIGLIIGGSNLQQRELTLTRQKYAERLAFLRPTYAMTFLDSDLCGLCTDLFPIRGFAYTLGGASAAGQLAVIQAADAVASGRVDVAVAVGALMDLSFWECAGFRAAGAMGSERFAEAPEQACRPFDEQRDGFIFGENCAALVVERAETSAQRGAAPRGLLRGTAVVMDGNRYPNPNADGEVRVIREALQAADLKPGEIDYINPHGTGSPLGDKTESEALLQCGLEHAPLNTTKSLTGHGLCAAGAVEIAATLVQMEAGRLHPSRNLDAPMNGALNFVGATARVQNVHNALCLSYGFGGVNTAVCLQNPRG